MSLIMTSFCWFACVHAPSTIPPWTWLPTATLQCCQNLSTVRELTHAQSLLHKKRAQSGTLEALRGLYPLLAQIPLQPLQQNQAD